MGLTFQRIANHPTSITDSVVATHLSVDQLSTVLSSSIKDTFPSASEMEIEDYKIPGGF